MTEDRHREVLRIPEVKQMSHVGTPDLKPRHLFNHPDGRKQAGGPRRDQVFISEPVWLLDTAPSGSSSCSPM